MGMATLDGVVREGLIEEVTSELRPDGGGRGAGLKLGVFK